MCRNRKLLWALLFVLSTVSLAAAFSPGTLNTSRRQQQQQETTTLKVASAVSTAFYPKQHAPKRTLYDILGASPDDSRDDLKHSYLEIAKRTHPDANPLLSTAGDQFAEAASAWETLSDRKQRLKYDRSLKAEEFLEQIEQAADEFFDAVMPFCVAVVEVTFEFTKAVFEAGQEISSAMQKATL